MPNLGAFIVFTKMSHVSVFSHLMLILRGSAICLLQIGTKHKYVSEKPDIRGTQNDFICPNIFQFLYKLGFCSGKFYFLQMLAITQKCKLLKMPSMVHTWEHVAIFAMLKK